MFTFGLFSDSTEADAKRVEDFLVSPYKRILPSIHQKVDRLMRMASTGSPSPRQKKEFLCLKRKVQEMEHLLEYTEDIIYRIRNRPAGNEQQNTHDVFIIDWEELKRLVEDGMYRGRVTREQGYLNMYVIFHAISHSNASISFFLSFS